MSRAQERSYEQGIKYLIPYQDTPINLNECFGNNNPVTIEIGFGMGKATAEIAAAHSDINYLGIEVFKAGIGKLLWEIEQRHLGNIRIIEHDAVEVLHNMIPPSSLSSLHLFFPDPWPKKKHHKRRLVQKTFAELCASCLAKGGYFYMVSDWEPYAQDALEVLSAIPSLHNPYNEGFAPQMQWRPKTKFEQKGIAKNHVIRELYFVKR